MSEQLKVWTIDETIRLMDEQKLLADTFPTFNDMSNTWDICLSDERGNGIEYISFATEEEADAFCEALDEEIGRRNA